MQFATNVLDLGRIVGGTVARCAFAFTNVGQQTLEIRDVRPSCGCTIAGEWTRSVAPGACGIIPFEITPANMNGPFSKTASVLSNDPVQPQLSLELAATVWKAVDILPPVVSFSFLGGGPTNSVKTVRITSKLDQPLQLQPPECANTNFQAELKTVEPGRVYELALRSVSVPNASVAVPVRLKSSSTQVPVITINVTAVVVPPIEARPRSVVLPAPTLRSRPTMATVTVLNHLDAPLRLSDPEVSIPGIRVYLQEVQTGQVFRVGLACPPELKIAAGQRGQVTIKTSDPHNPELVIPILPPVVPAITSRHAQTPADPLQPAFRTLPGATQPAAQSPAELGGSLAGTTTPLQVASPSSISKRSGGETPNQQTAQ